MSGHSKWASIKHKKGAADAKRGKVFTRHAKLIQIAAREGGGGDPGMNPSLKGAIDNAKADNVPNVNIDRAIKKGTGDAKGEQITAVTYEAYGPSGVALIIECLTDNKNRTLSNVRAAIERNGGKWAESGSVAYMFERKGVVVGTGELTEDAELALIDAGAQDIEASDGIISVTTGATNWAKVRDALKDCGITIEDSGLKYIALQDIAITDAESAQKVISFIEIIEEDDDVSEVFTNANITDEVAVAL